jgi:hypothetical protein
MMTNLEFKEWGKLFHNAVGIAGRHVLTGLLVRIVGVSCRVDADVE